MSPTPFDNELRDIPKILENILSGVDFLPHLNGLAEVLLEAGHIQEARSLLEKGMASAAGHPTGELGRTYLILSRVLSIQKEYDVALDYLSKAADLLGETQPSRIHAETLAEAGHLQITRKQPELAVRLFERAAEEWTTLGEQEAALLNEQASSHNFKLSAGDTATARSDGFAAMKGESEILRAALRPADRVAPSDLTVLIMGETGTGKDLLAKEIHKHSGRRARRFVEIVPAELSGGTLESELFGHVKGAFTGAVTDREGQFKYADGGTLFLNEIAETSPETQAKLLRVIDKGEFQRVGSNNLVHVDVRLIAATNRDLDQLVAAGQFRQDLYERLKGVVIRLPPLRERGGDIDILIDHFLRVFSEEKRKPIRTISKEARTVLCRYPWPGNVRELSKCLEQMVVMSEETETVLGVDDIPTRVSEGIQEAVVQPAKMSPFPPYASEVGQGEDTVERLRTCHWDVKRASRIKPVMDVQTIQNRSMGLLIVAFLRRGLALDTVLVDLESDDKDREACQKWACVELKRLLARYERAINQAAGGKGTDGAGDKKDILTELRIPLRNVGEGGTSSSGPPTDSQVKEVIEKLKTMWGEWCKGCG